MTTCALAFFQADSNIATVSEQPCDQAAGPMKTGAIEQRDGLSVEGMTTER
jgi:hypothetical protein